MLRPTRYIGLLAVTSGLGVLTLWLGKCALDAWVRPDAAFYWAWGERAFLNSFALVIAVTFVGCAIIARDVWLARRWSDREAQGCCGRCGYDLRASPSGCPECGFPAGRRKGYKYN